MSVEGIDDVLFTVEPDYYVGAVVLLCHARDAVHHIEIVSLYILHLQPAGHSRRHGGPQCVAPHCHSFGIIIGPDKKRGHGADVSPVAHKHSHTHHSLCRDWIGHGHKLTREGSLLLLPFRLKLSLGQLHAKAYGVAFGGQSGHQAAGEYHHHGAVHHILVDKAIAVAYHRGGDCGRSLTRGKAEHYTPVNRSKAEHFLTDPGRAPFCDKRHGNHIQRHPADAPSLEQGADVDKHTYPYQEIWNEYGVAYKLHVAHKR